MGGPRVKVVSLAVVEGYALDDEALGVEDEGVGVVGEAVEREVGAAGEHLALEVDGEVEAEVGDRHLPGLGVGVRVVDGGGVAPRRWRFMGCSLALRAPPKVAPVGAPVSLVEAEGKCR
jgi:hypothetical protein